MVLSPDYLQSQFASPEWAAAFGQDPQGRDMKLVPVMVRTCQPTGLLTSIVQIRIAGMDEASARRALIAGINQKRAKPEMPPAFPGAAAQSQPKAFPGPTPPSPEAALKPASPGLIPFLKRAPTDAEKRRFARQGFEGIRSLFEANLAAVAEQESRIEMDFQPSTATDFRAELFLDGKSKRVCRVWLGGMHSADNICFSESRHSMGDSCKEILALSQSGKLYFQAMMAMGVFSHEKAFDLKRLSPEQAAEYLWKRFVSPLER